MVFTEQKRDDKQDVPKTPELTPIQFSTQCRGGVASKRGSQEEAAEVTCKEASHKDEEIPAKKDKPGRNMDKIQQSLAQGRKEKAVPQIKD